MHFALPIGDEDIGFRIGSIRRNVRCGHVHESYRNAFAIDRAAASCTKGVEAGLVTNVKDTTWTAQKLIMAAGKGKVATSHLPS